MSSPDVKSMDSVETTAPNLPMRKNATKKSGTLSMMRKYPELSPVSASKSTAMPLMPPGANSLGVVNMKMASARTMPESRMENAAKAMMRAVRKDLWFFSGIG